MSKVLLIINMPDDKYEIFEKYINQEMIVDIGFNHDNMFGWTFMRRKVLCAKPIPKGHGRLIDADELLHKVQDYGEGQQRMDLIDPCYVKKAPTIIEADTGDTE